MGSLFISAAHTQQQADFGEAKNGVDGTVITSDWLFIVDFISNLDTKAKEAFKGEKLVAVLDQFQDFKDLVSQLFPKAKLNDPKDPESSIDLFRHPIFDIIKE